MAEGKAGGSLKMGVNLKLQNFCARTVSFIFRFLGLLPASLLAGFVTSLAFMLVVDQLNFENVDLPLIAFIDIVGNVLALPGLCLFLIWRHWRISPPSLWMYIVMGFLLALLNGLGVAFIFDRGFMSWEFGVFSLFFGVTGALTAAIHWQIIRYWTSPVVTSFRESAKRELYSQF